MTDTFQSFEAIAQPAGQTATTTPATIPFGDRFKSWLTEKPCPRAMLGQATAMVAEQNRIGQTRPPEEFSAVERNVRAGMQSRVNTQIADGTRSSLEPIVAAVRDKVQERNTLARDENRLADEPLIGPHGETLSIPAAQRSHDALVESIAESVAGGHTKNRRVAPAMRRFVEHLVWLDLPLFVYFMAGSLNVSVLNFFQTAGGWIRMVFAVVVGLFATIASARGLKFLGANHRAYKDDDGQWAGPPQMRPERLSMYALIVGVGGLMGYRIGSDVLASGMGHPLALVVAAVLGLASAVLNWSVYAAEYKDGSADTEQLDAYAAGLERITRNQQALRALVIILDEEIDKLILEGFRIGGLLRTENSSAALASPEDAAIRYARSVHQGAGYTGQLPTPELDWSPLEIALSHLSNLEAQFLAASRDNGLASGEGLW
ncbi:hypothetical protein EB73_07105 [Mycobacterium sp. SWH-M3]|nr:hypothetical protein EB73_07105 [Mycobacterium sp. SWH-M3]